MVVMEDTQKKAANLTYEDDNIRRYSVTGRAAHERVGRLLRRVVVDEEEAANEVEGSNVDDIARGGRQSAAVTTTKRWIDVSSYATHADNNNESQDDSNNNNNNAVVLDFLWENAPRSETKHVRDYVKCYSHLPNGSMLDDKWALARLMGHSSSFCASGIAASGGYYCNMRRGGHRERRTTKEELSTTSANSYYDNDTNHRHLATLESHCFRGTNGFEIFAKRVGLLQQQQQQQPPATTLMNNNITTSTSASTDADQTLHKYQFEDLISRSSTTNTSPIMTNEDSVGPPPMPSNLWVIKDSNSNGAGGIWIIDESNVYDFISPNDNDQVSSGNYDDDDDNTNSSLQIENKSTKTSSSSSSSPTILLNPNHRYVAQRYAWPPTLHSGRKCHVRAYVLLTCDGCAYLHRRAFLHVANEPFVYDNNNNSSNDTTTTTSGRDKAETIFDPSIHITNCCANSHDSTKFTGEICADLESMSYANNCCDNDHSNDNNNDPLPLGEYLPSISASVASIASSFRPFLKGGDANNGFEYLGLDFILSSMEVDEGLDDPTDELQRRPRQQQRLPVAYLLEINAPPSQDTATGLRHAEMLHDDVISDLLRLWVLPNVATATYDNNAVCDNNGGWRCVYTPPLEESNIANDDIATTSNKSSERSNLILPSKAAILNRIHWAMFESRVSKEYELYWKEYDEQNRNDELILLSSSKDINFCESSSSTIHHVSFDQQHSIDDFVIFVRSQFPYYSTATYAVDVINTTTRDNTSSRTQRHASIFFESGGGSQIPQQVVDAMCKSVCYRDRSVVGSQLEREARIALASLLINNKKGTSLIQRRSIPPIGNDNDDEYVTILGSNATSLLDLLARRMFASGILCHGDEIVVASENHLANVFPWLDLATKIDGEVQVKWWTVDATFNTEKSDIDHRMYLESSCLLSDLITERTKIVAISHVSNILGLERDIFAVCELVNRITKGKGHVVVDGVAAAPHFLSSNILSSIFSPAWYVVSLHKFFGPHLGCLLGKRSAVLQMTERSVNDTMCGEEKSMETDLSLYVSNETLAKSLELGTMNYEACSGAAALLKYVEQIGVNACVTFDIECHKCSTQQASNQITSESADIQRSSTVYLNIVSTCIHHVENRLVNHLLGYFQCVPLVRIIQDVGKMKVVNNIHGNRSGRRVPIICFTHANISSQTIVAHCRHHGVFCRSCKFLATDRLLDEMGINTDFVRFSLAHYNTLEEIVESIRVLESLAGWI